MTGGITLDLHVHTKAGSADSSLPVAGLGASARAVGVDGIVVAEHFRLWTAWEVESAAESEGLIIIPAREWSTTLGHVLAIGMSRHEPELRDPERLRRAADEEGALLIAAHPFRHFFDLPRQGLHPATLRTDDPDEAATLPIFRFVHAVEVANGACTERENAFAAAVAEVLGLPATAGSDAHHDGEIGRRPMTFPSGVTGPRELIQAIRAGTYGIMAPA